MRKYIKMRKLTVVLRIISLISAVACVTDSLLPRTCAVCSLGPVQAVLNVITALKSGYTKSVITQ